MKRQNNIRSVLDSSANMIISNCNCCVYSSCIFVINSIVAFYYEYYLYSFLFVTLLITSLIYHTNYNTYTYLLDQLSVFSIVFYGGYIFFQKFYRINTYYQTVCAFGVIAAFLLTLYLYLYGFIYTAFCFCECKKTSDNYHSLLHIISSIGHYIIVIM